MNKMKLREIINILEAEVITAEPNLNQEIKMVYGSDLMSDVLAYIREGTLLITGNINSQVVRTAEIAEIIAICFINDKGPHLDTLKMAQKNGIVLLKTKFAMFEACGRLYKAGLSGCDEAK